MEEFPMAKIISIEMTLSQMKVAEMDVKGKNTKIRSCFSVSLPQGAVEDGYIRDINGVADLLKEALTTHNIRTKKVCFAISSSRIANREVRIPYMKQSHIQSLVEANASDYFPIDASKYRLSYDIMGVEKKEEDAETTKEYRLMVLASPISICAAYQELCKRTGLHLVRIGSVGESIYHAMKETCPSGVHVLIKIEEKTSLITILKDGELSLQRTLNYGVDAAAETVRMYPVFGKNLDIEQAMEVLASKRCLRSSLELSPNVSEEEDTDDFVREARREVTESLRYLSGNITRMMDYYISRNQDVEFSSILCCGMGARVLGLPQLLTSELGMQVSVLNTLSRVTLPEESEAALADYVAVAGAIRSKVNLLGKSGHQKESGAENLRGAYLVFFTGLAAAILLAAGGIGIRVLQHRDMEQIQQRIDEESSIEEIYQTYNQAKAQYENFQYMYQYTNTPNEGLVAFIEEMEEKMPSHMTVESFSSTGTEVSFALRVTNKSEAANTLMQLRTFESLSDVTTTGLDQEEEGALKMTVTCTYAEPAILDKSQE